ncbi:barwin-like endoglucanase [Mycena floridula]|nr:barwin-like endoglucanase [Mycena floridula]
MVSQRIFSVAFLSLLATMGLATPVAVAQTEIAVRDTNTEIAVRDVFSGQQTGDGTFFSPGLGACGIFNVDSDFIVAVSHILYDEFPGATPNPNLNPICGRAVQASFGGRTVNVVITDKCAACAETDLDFSPAAFEALAPLSVGRLHGVVWTWL